MSIPFHCPQCNAFTEVDEQFAGQTGACATCGKTITIPTGSTIEKKTATRKRPQLPVPLLVTMALVGVIALGLFLLGALLAAYFVPSVVTVAQGPAGDCRDNMRLIASAMLAYEEDHGTLPPAFVADENGEPMHSWRVLLLPYLGLQGLYDEYRFDEPWDSEHNKKLVTRMPTAYSCPSDSGFEFGETNYAVITGKGMLFDGASKPSTRSVADGAANTVLLVEVSESQIPWTCPQDVSAARISWNINRDPKGIGSHHPAGSHVAMADGKVYRYAEILPAEQLRAMATVAGGERVDPASWAE